MRKRQQREPQCAGKKQTRSGTVPGRRGSRLPLVTRRRHSGEHHWEKKKTSARDTNLSGQRQKQNHILDTLPKMGRRLSRNPRMKPEKL
jgi:hypothetical protein